MWFTVRSMCSPQAGAKQDVPKLGKLRDDNAERPGEKLKVSFCRKKQRMTRARKSQARPHKLRRKKLSNKSVIFVTSAFVVSLVFTLSFLVLDNKLSKDDEANDAEKPRHLWLPELPEAYKVPELLGKPPPEQLYKFKNEHMHLVLWNLAVSEVAIAEDIARDGKPSPHDPSPQGQQVKAILDDLEANEDEHGRQYSRLLRGIVGDWAAYLLSARVTDNLPKWRDAHMLHSEVPDDGNCAFHTMAEQIYGDQSHIIRVRAAIVNAQKNIGMPSACRDSIKNPGSEPFTGVGWNALWYLASQHEFALICTSLPGNEKPSKALGLLQHVNPEKTIYGKLRVTKDTPLAIVANSTTHASSLVPKEDPTSRYSVGEFFQSMEAMLSNNPQSKPKFMHKTPIPNAPTPSYKIARENQLILLRWNRDDLAMAHIPEYKAVFNNAIALCEQAAKSEDPKVEKDPSMTPCESLFIDEIRRVYRIVKWVDERKTKDGFPDKHIPELRKFCTTSEIPAVEQTEPHQHRFDLDQIELLSQSSP
eukprot:GHVT01078386.1.p1 GENE.GHVT01078386.1~~GHVT01078386.1.p1  ORF type:complete len:532 (+),score=32.50 GHVT01078386.1:875-2470(+)